MISPPGLPVPKKVTARKQEPSASPGSGNFRDAVLNMHRAQALGPTQALPCKWVTAPSVVRGGTTKFGLGGAGLVEQPSRLREGDIGTPPWSSLQPERRAGCSRCPGRALLRFS